MASLSEGRNIVHYDEPAIKPPPLLTVGPLAWMRKNLFSSWLDAFLTAISAVFIVAVASSFIQWAISSANWFVLTYNLRLFMIGRYLPQDEWRVQAAALLVAFVVGFALATWTRLRRWLVILLAAILVLVFALPPIINALTPLPISYLAAANTAITFGSDNIQPQKQLAFIARAGETISLNIAREPVQSDEQLARLYSFMDRATNTLLNAAANRLNTARRLNEVEAQLAGSLLTTNQRTRLEAERNRLEIPPPLTETYVFNQTSVQLRLIQASTAQTLAETSLRLGDPALTVEIPADGWYILEKIVAGDDSQVVLLETRGIYPLFERSFIRGEELSETGEVTQVAGRASIFTRLTDGYQTTEPRPTADGKPVPAAFVIEQQYRGERPVWDYLRLHLGLALQLINQPLLLLILTGAAGYGLSRLVDRLLPSERRRTSARWATWMIIAAPVVVFALIYGFFGVLPLTDTRRWGGLLLSVLLTVVSIIASFPIGVLLALGRRSSLPAIRYVCTVYIEVVRGVPLITVLFMASLLVPLVNPALANVDTVFRAMVGITLFSAAYLAENVRGGLQSVPHGQEEAAKAVGLNNFQIILYITLPQALRAVIPALVGQFISLFKDTSLVAIIGLLDLTGMADTIVTQTEFIGLRREVLMFITALYFVFSYAMSAVSRRIEASGAGRVKVDRI